MQLPIEDKLINYIVNLDKLKDRVKVLKNKEKISEKNLGVLA